MTQNSTDPEPWFTTAYVEGRTGDLLGQITDPLTRLTYFDSITDGEPKLDGDPDAEGTRFTTEGEQADYIGGENFSVSDVLVDQATGKRWRVTVECLDTLEATDKD